MIHKYITLLLAFSFIAGCGNKKESIVNVDFGDTVEIKRLDARRRPEIKICVGSMVTPAEGYAFYKQLLDFIGKKLDMKVIFVEKNTYAEVNALLRKGDIDVAFVCGGPYVDGHDKFGLQLLAAPVVDEEAVYYSYIIVAKDSEIKKIEDLKGKTFVFVDPLSNTGKLIPTYILQKLGETPEGFFREYEYTYNHDTSIKAVAQGVADGAAVDSLIWEYMNKKGSKYTAKTRIIAVSEPYGIPPVVARPGLNNGLKTSIKDVLLNMHNDAEGKRILQQMFIDRFIETDDSKYDAIREVKSALKSKNLL